MTFIALCVVVPVCLVGGIWLMVYAACVLGKIHRAPVPTYLDRSWLTLRDQLMREAMQDGETPPASAPDLLTTLGHLQARARRNYPLRIVEVSWEFLQEVREALTARLARPPASALTVEQFREQLRVKFYDPSRYFDDELDWAAARYAEALRT